MIFKCGIIGLPNVGKSTFFNILTCSSVKSENFPFCTIRANHGFFTILDFRLCQLSQFIQTKKIVFGNIKLIDVAGLIKGASHGAGLGNRFLNDIIEADILFHIVRCFDQNNIYHVNTHINPKKDIEIINDELILSDIIRCEQLILVIKKNTRNTDKQNIKNTAQTLSLLEKCLAYLYDKIMLYQCIFDIKERIIIKNFNFFTYKPMIYIANISDNNSYIGSNDYLKEISEISIFSNVPYISMCILSASEFMKININDIKVSNKLFFERYFKHSKIFDIVNVIYHILQLKTFFTVNIKEARAWVVLKNTVAIQAANMIHSDFKKKFIRVQVVRYNDYVSFGGGGLSKKNGKMKIEGRNYLIKDGDILNFLI